MNLVRDCFAFIFALVVVGSWGFGFFVPPAHAGEKTSTERWLDIHRDPGQKPYFGEPIDLSLRNADLVETLRIFAEIGGFNLIVQPGVKGTVTVELKQVPWDQALEQILKLNSLGMEISSGKVNVAPHSSGRAQSFDMVTVRLVPVYADPAVIAQALNRPVDGVPSPGGSLRAVGASLVVRETPRALADFARVLGYVDLPSAVGESAESLAQRCVELWNRYVPERPITE